jgi:hypothetical protein
MKLKSSEIVDLFRVEMHDTAAPYLISDDQAFLYLDDAQKTLVRNIGGIVDATSPLTQITINVNDTGTPYDPRILKIRHAYRLSDGKNIDIADFEEMLKEGVRFDGHSGPIAALVLGMDDKNIMYYPPVIDTAETLQLMIDRLPLKDLTSDDPEAYPEIDPIHHQHLVIHMMARAYGNQDAEVFNKSKSIEKHAEFKAYCEGVFKEKERRKHKTRVVKYGGIEIHSRRRHFDYYRR